MVVGKELVVLLPGGSKTGGAGAAIINHEHRIGKRDFSRCLAVLGTTTIKSACGGTGRQT